MKHFGTESPAIFVVRGDPAATEHSGQMVDLAAFAFGGTKDLLSHRLAKALQTKNPAIADGVSV